MSTLWASVDTSEIESGVLPQVQIPPVGNKKEMTVPENITPGEFRLTYVWQRPGDRDAHVEIKTITAPSHDDARKQAKAIYEGHPGGTIIDDLVLIEVKEILYTVPRPTDQPTSPIPGKRTNVKKRGAAIFRPINAIIEERIEIEKRIMAIQYGHLCSCRLNGLLPGEKLCPKCRG